MPINSNVVLVQLCICGAEWEASLIVECCPECGFDKICGECHSEDTGNFDNGICRTCCIEQGECADCYDANCGYGNELCVACSSPAPVPDEDDADEDDADEDDADEDDADEDDADECLYPKYQCQRCNDKGEYPLNENGICGFCVNDTVFVCEDCNKNVDYCECPACCSDCEKVHLPDECEYNDYFKCSDCSEWFNPEKYNMYILDYKCTSGSADEKTICTDCFDRFGKKYKKDGWNCDDFDDYDFESDDEDDECDEDDDDNFKCDRCNKVQNREFHITIEGDESGDTICETCYEDA